jgi:hypothetical protein
VLIASEVNQGQRPEEDRGGVADHNWNITVIELTHSTLLVQLATGASLPVGLSFLMWHELEQRGNRSIAV